MRERQREKYLERKARAEEIERDTYRGAAKAPSIDAMRLEFLDGGNESILLEQLGRLDARDPAQWDPINEKYEATAQTFAEAFAVVAKAARRDWRDFDWAIFRECAGLAGLTTPPRLLQAEAAADEQEHYDQQRALRPVYCASLDEIEAAGGYQIVYADPPWSYNQRGRGAADNHYETMSMADLRQLPIPRLAAKDAVLFLWATMPLLPEALELGHAWGFAYKTCAFTWVKYYEPSGKPAMGGGMWTRANAELCLLFVRGEPPRRVSAGVRQLVESEDNVLRAPRGSHSAKPVEIRRRIDALMGDGPTRIELFARDRVDGWDAWGAEVPGGSNVNMRPENAFSNLPRASIGFCTCSDFVKPEITLFKTWIPCSTCGGLR